MVKKFKLTLKIIHVFFSMTVSRYFLGFSGSNFGQWIIKQNPGCVVEIRMLKWMYEGLGRIE